jgi:MFS family permease
MDLLRERALSSGLLSMALVSAILMATLVVGPFYLSGALGLGPVQIGLVMSVGPGVAALTGAPAGRLVDGLGSFRVIVAGLLAVAAGSILLTALPGRFGVGGYVASLVVITFGYALFQAANTTAVMQGAASDGRGVTSALLGLSRNLGLISGASAMGAVYAAGPRIAKAAGFGAGDEAGLRLTFVVAAGLAGLALGATWWGQRRD